MTEQVAEIKARIDIVGLVSQYLPLLKAGRNYKALCPFHREKTPSFMVSPELQIFKCFGCGAAGDIYSFVQQMEGVEFPEALRILAEKAGVKLSRFAGDPRAEEKKRLSRINEQALRFFEFLLAKHRVGRRAREYLARRGIKNETIKKFELGYAPSSWDSLGKYLLGKKFTLGQLASSGLVKPREGRDGKFYDLFRGRIIFPLKDEQGRVAGFSGRALSSKQSPKYINIAETPLFKRRHLLYGLDVAKTEVKRQRQAIVVEGEFDFLAPYQAGTKNIVASKGTSLTLEQIRLLKRFAQEILLAFDADVAGDEAVQRGIALAQSEGLEVRVIVLPTGKDPDECVRADPGAWQKAVGAAVPVMEFYFNHALSNFSSQTAGGKREIAAYLLPKIKVVSSEVEQSHYLQRLGAEIGVSEEVLRTEMGKLGAPAANRRPPIGKEEVGKGIGEAKSRQDVLEEYMLSLLLQCEKDLAKTTLYKLGREDFAGGETGKIFEVFKDYLWTVKRFEMENLRKKIKRELSPLFDRLVLTPLAEVDDGERMAAEIAAAFGELKREGLRRRLKDISQAIKLAESEGRAKEVKKRQKEYQEVLEKLR